MNDARALAALLRALQRRFSISERADVACCGMTVAQAAALGALAAERRLGLGDLGHRLGVAPSTLTRNLDRLVERGLVTRVADPVDARAAGATLTPSGRRAARRVARQDEAFARTILEHLPAERRAQATAALSDLMVAVRAATERCCPGAFDHLMQDFPAAPAKAVTASTGGEGRPPRRTRR